MAKTKENKVVTDKATNQTKGKRKVSISSIIIIVGCIIICIPFLILGGILLAASSDTGEPILGDRFEGDLDPAITDDNQNNILQACESIDGVEGCSIVLKTATLRLYIDTEDDITSEEFVTIIDEGYDAILNELSATTYFTSSSTKKMYDLEVHAYNSLDKIDADDYIYLIKNKTSNMAEPNTQVVSEALDETLAQSLRDAVEARLNPTATPDTSVDSDAEGDVEADDETTEE
ncbi:MAG: hypothetical protein R3Y57_05925 [Erysipelotrichaceae bacterium]